MTPEAKVRIEIDKKLISVGYTLQDMKAFDPSVRLVWLYVKFQPKVDRYIICCLSIKNCWRNRS